MLTYKMWHVGGCRAEIYATCYGYVLEGWGTIKMVDGVQTTPEEYHWWGLVLGDWSYGFGIHIWREYE